MKAERPNGLAEWIKRARTSTYEPSIQDAAKYGDKWYAWWYAIQPESQHIRGSHLLLWKGRHNLSNVVLCGPNGFLNVVKSLSWWKNTITLGSDTEDWDDAVADVLWVLKHHTT